MIWIKQQLYEYGIKLNCVPIFCDSLSVISIFKDPAHHSRVKHPYHNFFIYFFYLTISPNHHILFVPWCFYIKPLASSPSFTPLSSHLLYTTLSCLSLSHLNSPLQLSQDPRCKHQSKNKSTNLFIINSFIFSSHTHSHGLLRY